MESKPSDLAWSPNLQIWLGVQTFRFGLESCSHVGCAKSFSCPPSSLKKWWATKRRFRGFSFFSRSHALAWERIGDAPASRNPQEDAGASRIGSHAGAWEPEKKSYV
ncbi:hypothetical protein QUF54_01965 [Candidatus Marithioploca araucensis]|uniref:Uncharacterized protein n=1 Tax=Candidatus Marithioploca araucensis TaxID=70273 RepID=A0ABT7VR12_9GAMM|nr:hypothetical protein [Candidatus Marithioploca araucensis]